MTGTLSPSPGSIVSCRSRQWVVLPSENQDVIRLRPLSGNEDEIAGIYQKLLEEKLENIQLATFPLPQANSVQDHAAALLLMDAARLLLRSGAGPFRCLEREAISIKFDPSKLFKRPLRYIAVSFQSPEYGFIFGNTKLGKAISVN
ncbi:hypothetical protein [Nostoc sp.]